MISHPAETWRKDAGTAVAVKRYEILWATDEMKEFRLAKAAAQIEFTDWTPDGALRHANFTALWDVKQARTLVIKKSKALYTSSHPTHFFL